MGHACAHDDFPQVPPPNGEHPVVGVVAIIAIFLAILLITWARFEVHGSEDIEAALEEPVAQGDLPVVQRVDAKTDSEREIDAAVTANRFATGFSP